MRDLNIYGILISLLIFLASCNEITCIRVSSNSITESRELSGYKGVVFNHAGDLKLTQGPEFSFTITGPENVVELTKTKIDNGLLIIWTDDCFNGQGVGLVVEVTAPIYESINLSGAGSISTVGEIEGDVIEMELVGSGDIVAGFNAHELLTTVSGSGDINYSGTTLSHSLSCSGQFTFNGYALETDHTSIDVIGIGDSYIKANETLTVKIEGTGNVHYRGSPVIRSDITGIGEIIDSN